ncbi:hypothetical protein NFI96_002072 [Prochilodus magdalenae]|nr:hypothetical protein NFI96_002072 [Prochilodus magdalenae]
MEGLRMAAGFIFPPVTESRFNVLVETPNNESVCGGNRGQNSRWGTVLLVTSVQRPGVPPPSTPTAMSAHLRRNCVRMFKLHGMDYHKEEKKKYSTPFRKPLQAPYRDVWRVGGLANHSAPPPRTPITERQTSVFFASVRSGGSSQVYFMTLGRTSLLS